nr:uncharacterized protein LOC123774531 [Procambarus clarkii]
MDGGGGDSRGGGWRGGNYDATNQIKQLLKIPAEEPEKANVDARLHTSPLNIPVHRQGQLANEHYERSGSPSNKPQRWDNNRYHDGRHRVDAYGSPGRTNVMYRPQSQRYRDFRQSADIYGSPSRSNHRQGSYDRGYVGSPRNQHQYQHQQQHRGTPKDHKDMRMNGPRQINAPTNSQVASDAESPDFRPSPEILSELEEQFLFPLKKKSIRFPKAKYFCRLCDYHCDSLVVCRRHISDTRHRKLKESKDVETTLKNVPSATDGHIASIDKLVTSIADKMKVTPDMTKQRQEVVTQLNGLLVNKVEGCHLEMVGSSVSGFCLKTSDINIDVVMDDELNPSTALLAVKELVGKSDIYKDVLDDLSSSFPTMSFTHAKTNLRMVVGASSTSSKFTNQLLADYASLDSRVPTLGVAFRYWAQLCQIDDQTRGTLPPHVFPLMVVHFLQQHEPPVLPVLHELHPNPNGDVYLSSSELGDKWKCKNNDCVGKLWLDLFRFYTVGFKMSDYIINIRQYQPITRAEKTWSKKIAIEDPFLQKRNLTRTVSGNPVFEYIADRFKTTYKYFAIPQLSYGPLFLHITVVVTNIINHTARVPLSGVTSKNKRTDLLETIQCAGNSLSEGSSECEMERTEDDIDVAIEGEEYDEEDPGNLSGFEADLSTLSIEETLEEPHESLSPNGLSSQEEESSLATLEDLSAPIPFVTPSQAARLMLQVQENQIILRFDGKVFTLGQKPPLICGSCQKEGHSKADCREDELPPLKRLPPMNGLFLSQLTAIFEQLTKDFEPSIEEIEDRDRIVADLEKYIRQFFRGVTLKLFGSSANGFGFQRSDLDICLTFEGNPSGDDINHIKIIESLAEKLKRYRQCGHVFAITTAKVPIVKFSIRQAFLEGDLSLYNTLALQNTKLLHTYANIDHRVKCLGYAMKYFAKLCDIGDASRGSLSSYAYILMVLHFLQQCKPPVIPVLQELWDHSKPAPRLMIDGWNAWFYEDVKSLRHVWKDHGKNKESVGHLWVSMLCYYTETFNWKENVVTIRQFAPLTRLQKLWNSRCIVIEDPFDLSHNLGAGLSRKSKFCSLILLFILDYLFDSKQLTDGAPPNDRGCRFCGKIGHIQKDCPKKRLNMEKREKKERQKDRRETRRISAETEDRDGERQKHILEQSTSQDGQENESRDGTEGPGEPTLCTGIGALHGLKTPEDVVTGNSTCQTSTTKLEQLQAATSRTTNRSQAKSLNEVTGPLPASGTPNVGLNITVKSGVNTTQSGVSSVHPGTDTVKPGIYTSEGESLLCSLGDPLSVVTGLRVGARTGVSCISSSALSNSGLPANVLLGSANLLDWGGTEKSTESVSSGAVSVPPGFQHLANVSVGLASQGQAIPDHINPEMKLNSQGHTLVSQTSKQQGPSYNTNVNNIYQMAIMQQKPPQSQQQEQQQAQHQQEQQKQQEQLKQKPQQQQKIIDQEKQQRLLQQEQQQQQSLQQHRHWEYWPASVLSQPIQLATKSQKQEPQKPKTYQTTTAVSTTQTQPHQQQYPYSISPAALFHMASQAAGGQMSAVLLPSVSESNTSRPGMTVSTASTVSSGGTQNSSGSGAPPPPGFSAPIAVNYHSQPVDAVQFNKLMIRSPLYRSPVTQPDGQSAVSNTASQTFLSVGQSLSGPVAGIYAVQPGSGGSQFTSIAPTLTGHSPHAFGDPSLSQQQVPYDTRHFISQQVAPGLHQGIPQGLGATVPQGVPQGVAQRIQGGTGVQLPPPGLTTSVPQGMSQNVPQGVPQGVHQTLPGGVSMGSALSQGIQALPMGHALQQHHYPQPSYPQQGYQMTVAGPSGFYPEFVFGDPGLQNPSSSGQGPPTLPAEMMTEMAFSRPDVYDAQMQPLPQYLPSTLPQHQSLISQITQPHPSVGLTPHHTPLSATGPATAYTPSSVIYIDGERDGSQILQ